MCNNFELDEIDLYLTMNCNLNCTFCSVKANEYNHKDLNLDEIKKIIDDASLHGLKDMHLTGGEPSLRNDLEQIIIYAAKKNISTRLITNGTLLERKRLLKLKESGLSGIMISIDGLKKTHDKMRKADGAWEKAIICAGESKELGLITRVSSVAFKNNIDEIPELLQIAVDIKLDIFSVFLGSPLGRGKNIKDQILNEHEWGNFLDTLKNKTALIPPDNEINVIAEQGFNNTKDSNFNIINTGRGTGCKTLLNLFDYLIIRSDGNVYQCVFFIHDGVSLGNIRGNNLAAIIQNVKATKNYEKFTQVPKECENCLQAQSCHGGCRGMSYIYHNDWFKKDPRCKLQNNQDKQYYPLCPITKINLKTGVMGGSSEHVIF